MNSVLELIQCPVCMNTNSDPMVLSCGHSICSDCVEKMIARNQRKCPTCNAGEINSNLQLSRATQSLVGTFHSLATMKCPNCEEIVRVSDMFKCERCNGAIYCADCVIKFHRNCPVQDFETLIGVSQEHLKPWMESTATQWLKDNTLLLDKVRQQLVRFDQTVLHVAKVLSQAAECERAAFQNYERVLQRLRAHYDALGDVLCVGDRPSVDSTLAVQERIDALDRQYEELVPSSVAVNKQMAEQVKFLEDFLEKVEKFYNPEVTSKSFKQALTGDGSSDLNS